MKHAHYFGWGFLLGLTTATFFGLLLLALLSQ